jgi:hypothetical protein
MHAQPRPVFPFFVGAGRSGTTLLRAMFTNHPELAIAHESRFVPFVLDRAGHYEAGDRFALDEYVFDALRNEKSRTRVPEWEVDLDWLTAEIQAAAPTTTVDAVRATFGAYAKARGKPGYGDKTPGYRNHVATLAAAFPESRFVHLIRDGRDVALALRDVDFGANDVVQAAIGWRRAVARTRAAGRPLGDRRYLEVRYEDLVDDPESVTRRICAFLDLPFVPELLEFHQRPDRAMADLGSQKHHESLRKPITRGLRDWRTQMSDGDVQLVEAHAGDLLADVGYEVRYGQRHDPWTRVTGRVRTLYHRADTWRRARRRRRSRSSGA